MKEYFEIYWRELNGWFLVLLLYLNLNAVIGFLLYSVNGLLESSSCSNLLELYFEYLKQSTLGIIVLSLIASLTLLPINCFFIYKNIGLNLRIEPKFEKILTKIFLITVFLFSIYSIIRALFLDLC